MVELVVGAAVNLTVTPDTDGSLRRLWLSCYTNTSSASGRLTVHVCLLYICILYFLYLFVVFLYQYCAASGFPATRTPLVLRKTICVVLCVCLYFVFCWYLVSEASSSLEVGK